METNVMFSRAFEMKSFVRIAILPYALLAMALPSCAAPPEASEDVGTNEEPIRNGDAVPACYAEVVQVNSPGGGCSGAMLTNSLILTAKHCIYNFGRPEDFSEANPVPPANVYPATGMTVRCGSQVRTGSFVLWNDAASDTAVIRVTAPFNVAGTTTGLTRAVRHPAITAGISLECYGYGNNNFITTPGGATQEVGFGTLRHSTNTVSSVNGATFSVSSNASGQIMMGGDSGGACFLGQEIAGVMSRSNRETSSTLAHGNSFVGWLDPTLALFPGGNDVANGVQLRDHLGGIYVVMGGAPLHISSLQEYSNNWNNGSLRQTGPLNLPAVPRDGTLLRDPGGEIDVFYGGARFPIPSMAEFYALGFTTAALLPAPSGSFFAMPRTPRNGVALRDRATGEIDIISGGKRWHVLSMTTYSAFYASWPLYQVPAGGLNVIPFGGSIP
jgi:Trypsin